MPDSLGLVDFETGQVNLVLIKLARRASEVFGEIEISEEL